MKKISITLLLCLLCLTGMAQGQKALDLKDITSGRFRPENIQGVIPMPDGEHYTQMNADGTQIIKYSFKTGEKVEVIFDVNTTRECDFKNFDSYQFSPDGQKLLIATKTTPIYRHSYTAVHYIYPLKRNDKGVTTNNIIERLSDGGPQQVPVFSPDGTMIAFVRNNNIFLVKLLYGNSESQITEDGKQNSVLNGIPDWVYEEEFGFDRALEFSADNTLIAFIRFDESEVPSYSFPVFAGQAPRIDALKDYLSKSSFVKNNIQKIQQVVAEYYNITVEDLKSKKRKADIAFPRQVAIYLCRTLTDESFPKIGIQFGGRDHSTVMHSVDKIDNELKTNPQFKDIIDALKSKIK